MSINSLPELRSGEAMSADIVIQPTSPLAQTGNVVVIPLDEKKLLLPHRLMFRRSHRNWQECDGRLDHVGWQSLCRLTSLTYDLPIFPGETTPMLMGMTIYLPSSGALVIEGCSVASDIATLIAMPEDLLLMAPRQCDLVRIDLVDGRSFERLRLSYQLDDDGHGLLILIRVATSHTGHPQFVGLKAGGPAGIAKSDGPATIR